MTNTFKIYQCLKKIKSLLAFCFFWSKWPSLDIALTIDIFYFFLVKQSSILLSPNKKIETENKIYACLILCVSLKGSVVCFGFYSLIVRKLNAMWKALSKKRIELFINCYGKRKKSEVYFQNSKLRDNRYNTPRQTATKIKVNSVKTLC